MNWRSARVAIMVCLVTALGGIGARAADDLPRTFGGCVAEGGVVRAVDDEITCRLVRSYDFRVYGSAETECSERVELEVWGETREGVVTYLLEPGRTIELPVVGEEGMALPTEPIPCLAD